MSNLIVLGQRTLEARHFAELERLIQIGVIPETANIGIVAEFFRQCDLHGFDYAGKQLYIVPRGGKFSIQISIDGYLSIAEKTGQLIGVSDYRFNDNMTEYECRKAGIKHPTTATVTVKRLINGVVGEFTATAGYDAYAVYVPEWVNGKRTGKMILAEQWDKGGFNQNGKCALALALRKGFPRELNPLRTIEEMEHTNNAVIVEEKPSTKLVNWALDTKLLTTDDVKNAKAKLFPNEKVLNQLQCDTIQAHLEEKILELKALEVA